MSQGLRAAGTIDGQVSATCHALAVLLKAEQLAIGNHARAALLYQMVHASILPAQAPQRLRLPVFEFHPVEDSTSEALERRSSAW